LYAKWTINSYTLTYSAGTNGAISGTASQTVNYGASGTAVTANANSGYRFSNWSDDSTANPRTDSNVMANITVTANFLPVIAPNSTVVRADGKIVAAFSTVGTGTWTVPGDATNMEVLVVGGGGGASRHSSGGGAGGLYSATTYTPSGSSVAITVGAGGAGSPDLGANGALSQFDSIIAYGGQGVTSSHPTDNVNQDGQLPYHAGNQGAYSINGGVMIVQGNPGGAGSSSSIFSSGGGAGAPGAYGNGSAGGIGVQDDITGTSTYYAGGGGATVSGPGGLGGGGKGGNVGILATSGEANTGGGAGGGYSVAAGASGGSGVVILAYNSPASICTVTFNSSGGSTVSSQTVISGAAATAPTAPTWAGHTFVQWCSDSGLTTAFNFSTAITANRTLYAKWQASSNTLTYAGWAGESGYQLSGGPADDDDGDGLTNYQEFAFGLDPTKGTSAVPARHLGGAHFSYTRYAESDLAYTVWISTNLKDWNQILPAAMTSIQGAADGKGVVTVDVTLKSPPAGDKLFLRVQAE
jgi:uncharacterized repeat protein (TIGR02543 family)